MKIKIEIDVTPEEVQDLFIPGEKQQEFAAAMARAYTEAMTEAAASAFQKTVDTLNPFAEKK
jgi:hypothetical protein